MLMRTLDLEQSKMYQGVPDTIFRRADITKLLMADLWIGFVCMSNVSMNAYAAHGSEIHQQSHQSELALSDIATILTKTSQFLFLLEYHLNSAPVSNRIIFSLLYLGVVLMKKTTFSVLLFAKRYDVKPVTYHIHPQRKTEQ